MICAIKTVANPSENWIPMNFNAVPIAMKRSIKEIPVTISAFSMGMFVIPIISVRGFRFIL